MADTQPFDLFGPEAEDLKARALDAARSSCSFPALRRRARAIAAEKLAQR